MIDLCTMVAVVRPCYLHIFKVLHHFEATLGLNPGFGKSNSIDIRRPSFDYTWVRAAPDIYWSPGSFQALLARTKCVKGMYIFTLYTSILTVMSNALCPSQESYATDPLRPVGAATM